MIYTFGRLIMSSIWYKTWYEARNAFPFNTVTSCSHEDNGIQISITKNLKEGGTSISITSLISCLHPVNCSLVPAVRSLSCYKLIKTLINTWANPPFPSFNKLLCLLTSRQEWYFYSRKDLYEVWSLFLRYFTILHLF